jgi:hypothetical protein
VHPLGLDIGSDRSIISSNRDDGLGFMGVNYQAPPRLATSVDLARENGPSTLNTAQRIYFSGEGPQGPSPFSLVNLQDCPGIGQWLRFASIDLSPAHADRAIVNGQLPVQLSNPQE